MAVEFGDIWPQVSGSAALGAEMTNGGFTGEARPWAAMHANSGVFHEPLTGSSGVVRYRADTRSMLDVFGLFRGTGFELSFDGGLTYGLGFGVEPLNGQNIIDAVNDKRTQVRSSGISTWSIGSFDVNTIWGDINLFANTGSNISLQSALKTSITASLPAGSPGVSYGIDFSTLYSNIRLQAGILGANYGDILLSAWAASGQMQYKFGPYQGWAVSASNLNGGAFFPIAHSGNVNQMIQQVVTGDILPDISGVRNLGYQKLGTIFHPYNSVHALSGIIHDPIYGGSGVIRFGLGIQLNDANQSSFLPGGKLNAFEFSTDGGKTFPIRLGSASGTISDSVAGIQQGFGFIEAGEGRALLLRGSGMQYFSQGDIRFLALPYDGDPNSQGNFTINTFNNINLDNSLGLQNNSSINLNAGASLNVTAFNSLSFNAPNPFPVGGQAIFNLADQFIVNVYRSSQVSPASGSLRYQFGPYEGWYWKGSNQIGNPLGNVLPSSGAVNQMIQASRLDIGSGLQQSYNAGDEIAITSRPALTPRGLLIKYPVGARTPKADDPRSVFPGYGIAVSGASPNTNIDAFPILYLAPNCVDIQGSGLNAGNLWVGVDDSLGAARIQTSGILRIAATSGVLVNSKTTFASSGLAPVNISGVYVTPPLSSLIMGDIYMLGHSVISGIIGVNDGPTAAARALGIGCLVINTGSGIINVSVGSGIMQCINNGLQNITQVFSDVNLNFITQAADQNYTLTTAANTSGVLTVMSPGLYKISYKIAATKNVGSTPQFVETRLVVNNNGIAVLGSTIDSFHFDTTAAKASATATLLQNLNAGDNIRLQITSNLDGTNNCQIPNRGALLIIEKIGPTRGVF